MLPGGGGVLWSAPYNNRTTETECKLFIDNYCKCSSSYILNEEIPKPKDRYIIIRLYIDGVLGSSWRAATTRARQTSAATTRKLQQQLQNADQRRTPARAIESANNPGFHTTGQRSPQPIDDR